MKSVYIDVGESGLYALGEFEVISTLGQMEFVTAEEVAGNVLFEIEGRNTGHDVVNALDSASMGPSYRAGVLRNYAIKTMKNLEKEHGCHSVAFEMLGPPRLSKLLFECFLLKKATIKINNAKDSSPKDIAKKMENLLLEDETLISEIISIGIPILLCDGKEIIRGPKIKIPATTKPIAISDSNIDTWSKEGWVDLRPPNIQLWLNRLEQIRLEINFLSKDMTSSSSDKRSMTSMEEGDLEIGEIVGWIFNKEERGERVKN